MTAIKYNFPFCWTGYGPQSVFPGWQFLALYYQISSSGECCCLIGAGAPNFTVRHESSKNIAAFLKWTTIDNFNIKSVLGISYRFFRTVLFGLNRHYLQCSKANYYQSNNSNQKPF